MNVPATYFCNTCGQHHKGEPARTVVTRTRFGLHTRYVCPACAAKIDRVASRARRKEAKESGLTRPAEQYSPVRRMFADAWAAKH